MLSVPFVIMGAQAAYKEGKILERKNMFITIAIRNEVDISWLPGAKTDWENSRQKYMDLSGDTKPEESLRPGMREDPRTQ